MAALVPAARESRGRLIFVTVDADDEENDKVLDFFEITDESDLPVYMIFDIEKNARHRSDNNAKMDAKEISEFCRKYREGDLKRTLKSQDVPKDWDKKAVKVRKISNFASSPAEAKSM